jgi:hypothetical protein
MAGLFFYLVPVIVQLADMTGQNNWRKNSPDNENMSPVDCSFCMHS